MTKRGFHLSFKALSNASIPNVLEQSAARPTTKSFNTAMLLPIAILFASFLAVVVWFGEVDFYHRHFFDTGRIIFVNNAMRIAFVFILSSLVYAPGAGIFALVSGRRADSQLAQICMPARRRAHRSPSRWSTNDPRLCGGLWLMHR